MPGIDVILLAIVASTPLLLAVEGELVVERAGMINLGIEGMMLTAAMTSVVAAQLTGSAIAGFAGGIAGLAGGIELLGVTHRLFERFAAGYGYSGIAVALLGELHPLATLASALFFGALTTGAGELQRAANISSQVATFGQAVVILTLIAFGRMRARD